MCSSTITKPISMTLCYNRQTIVSAADVDAPCRQLMECWRRPLWLCNRTSKWQSLPQSELTKQEENDAASCCLLLILFSAARRCVFSSLSNLPMIIAFCLPGFSFNAAILKYFALVSAYTRSGRSKRRNVKSYI